MRRHNHFARAVLALGLTLSLGLSPQFTRTAEATVVVQLDRARLVRDADLVVRATVGNARSMWNEDHTQIVTLTTLTVTQYIKGSDGAELVLRQFGGQVDGLVSRVSGDAQLEAGQDVVLCLRRGAGVVYLTALAQSVWFLTPQSGGVTMAARDLAGLTFTQLRNGQYQVIEHPAAEPRETAPALLTSLSRLVANGGAR